MQGDPRHGRAAIASFLLANVLILGLLAVTPLLLGNYPDLLYQLVQEDAPVEWATFWSFVTASGLFAVAAARQRRRDRLVPWFLAKS